ncbi:hypothetical protein SLA2020_314500 [Shorea laevis]
MDIGPMMEPASKNTTSKGKEAVESSKTPSLNLGSIVDLGHSSSSLQDTPPVENAFSPKLGTSGSISNASTDLENSLLTVKERIKNLEKSSTICSALSASSIPPQPSLEVSHEQTSGGITNLPAQPQLESSTSQQQQCNLDGGSLRVDAIKGGENTTFMEGEGSVQGVAQSSTNSQIHKSWSFSKLNTSFEGRSDSFDRSMQCSKVRVHFRRSRHRREKGPYPTSETPSSSMVGPAPNFRQILNLTRDEGNGLQLTDASISFSGGLNDADAQGNSGANVRQDTS